eukprot:1394964-Amorphochlora_amoeboformis.AAC.1
MVFRVSMWDIVHPEDVERCQAEIAMAARNGKSNVELSCRVSCLDGCLVMVRKRVRHLGKTEVKCETQVIETKDVLMNNLWSKLTVLMDAFVTSCDSLKQTKLSQIQKSLLVRMEESSTHTHVYETDPLYMFMRLISKHTPTGRRQHMQIHMDVEYTVIDYEYEWEYLHN